MKYCTILLLLCSAVYSQITVVDSTKWVSMYVDKENIGDEKHSHEWVVSDPWPTVEEGNEFIRRAVCYGCKRVEIQKLIVYSHVVIPEKTLFETTIEKVNPGAITSTDAIYINQLQALKVSGAIDEVPAVEAKPYEPIYTANAPIVL